MTEKQLRTLGKVEMLQLLRDQELEIERLTQQTESLEQQLEERKLSVDNAGSIAMAALQVTDIFRVAQESADLYIYNIRQMEERCKAEVETAEATARRKAEEILREVERKCAARESYEKQYVEELWEDFHHKLTQFCQSHSEVGDIVKKINLHPVSKDDDDSYAENGYE